MSHTERNMADLFNPEASGSYIERRDNEESIEQYRQTIARQHDELLRKYLAGEVARDELNKQVANLVANQERELREAEQKAAIDTLTGLYRPELFNNLVVHSLKQMAREVRSGIRKVISGSFLFMDLDRFKQVNDQLKHQAGNMVLEVLGQTVLTGIRPGDIACRYGGEEVVIFLPHQDAEKAAIAANRYREAVPANVSTLHPQLQLHQTVSIGVADFSEQDLSIFESEEKINKFISTHIDRADAAMYDAKRAGRNRVSLSKIVYLST